MHIDRCICTGRTFAELLDAARQGGLSLPELIRETGASGCCAMCGPYVRRAYRTGRTSFETLLSQDDEPPPSGGDRVVGSDTLGA